MSSWTLAMLSAAKIARASGSAWATRSRSSRLRDSWSPIDGSSETDSTSPRDACAEPVLELCAGGRGLLRRVVQEPGGDYIVWLALAVKQPADLDRMADERRVVDLPVLLRVACGGELERSLRDRQAGELVGGGASPGGDAVGKIIVEDAMGFVSDHAARGSRLSRASSLWVCSSDRLRAAGSSPRRWPARVSSSPPTGRV
jgi:hypothetical protein